MIAALLLALAQGATPPVPGSGGRAAPAQGAEPSSAQVKDAERTALLARWRESLELDFPGEVLDEGRARMAPGGDLEHDSRALALFARALAARGEREAAKQLLAGRPKALPVEFVTAERARLLLEEDELEAALDLLLDRGATNLRSPATAEAHWVAGRALARLGDYDRAAPLFERFLALEPHAAEAPSAWHQLAQAALRKGDTARAQQCAAREDALGRWHAFYRVRRLQIREQPKEPLPRLGLAQLWLEIDNLGAAREVLDELLALAPEFAPAWLARGETLRKLEDLDGARASYDRALELDAALPIARMNRAVIARVQNREADARRDLELLVADPKLEPRISAGAHLELARILARAGETARAQALHARYRELGGKEAL